LAPEERVDVTDRLRQRQKSQLVAGLRKPPSGSGTEGGTLKVKPGRRTPRFPFAREIEVRAGARYGRTIVADERTFGMTWGRGVIHLLRKALGRACTPFQKDDVTDRLRSTIEELQATRREAGWQATRPPRGAIK